MSQARNNTDQLTVPADILLDIRGDMQLDADETLRGWCWSPSRPRERLAVEIMFDAAVTAQVGAGEFRRDLHDKGIGDGRHGFSFRLPRDLRRGAGAPGMISARAARGHQVFGRVRLVNFPQAGAHDATLDRIAATLAAMARSLDATAKRPSDPGTWLQAGFAAVGTALAGEHPVNAARSRLFRHGPPPRLTREAYPAATLVRLAGGDAGAEWRWLAAMAGLTATHAVELLLIDPALDPHLALFPALVEGLAFRRAPGASTLAHAVDHARGARGAMVLFAGPDSSPAGIGALLAGAGDGVLLPRATADALGLGRLPAWRLPVKAGLALALPRPLLPAVDAASFWPSLLAAAAVRKIPARVLDEPWAPPA